MWASRKTTTFGCWGLCLVVAVAVCACSVPKWTLHSDPSFTLMEPTTVSTSALSLTVGTNGWPMENTLLEESFLPVPVTMRNTSARALCGGVASARLSDASGASVAASFPTNVVARLFGPLAKDDSSGRMALSAARPLDDRGSIVFVHGGSGGHGGGLGHGGHYAPHTFGATPRFFGSPFSFSPFAAPRLPFYSNPYAPFGYPFSPFAAPRSPFYSNPYAPFGSPYSFSPFAAPGLPFYANPYSPFGYPFSPTYPYSGEFAPYSYAPALPSEVYPQYEAPTEDTHRLISEIFTLAFVSRPLTPQEDRSGFLFFPRPLPTMGAPLLTWDWYDCETQVFVTQLSTPVVARKRI